MRRLRKCCFALLLCILLLSCSAAGTLFAADAVPHAVLDARAKLPDAALVVLSPKAAGAQPLEPSMRGVTFASPATVGAEVCRLLAVPCAGGWQEE